MSWDSFFSSFSSFFSFHFRFFFLPLLFHVEERWMGGRMDGVMARGRYEHLFFFSLSIYTCFLFLLSFCSISSLQRTQAKGSPPPGYC